MRVCDQFTDAQMGRFFAPLNHEMEVHSTVDLGRTPVVIGSPVELPIAIVGTLDKVRGVDPSGLVDGVRLAQGERLLGIQSKLELDSGVRRRYIDEDDLSDFGDDHGVSPESLAGLTHMLVSIDWSFTPYTRSIESAVEGDDRFDENGVGFIPVGDPIPELDDAFEDREVFNVRGMVNENGNLVRWQKTPRGARGLVDLCVMNTYVHNRVELEVLRFEIGHGFVLQGLLDINEDTTAYLKRFDNEARSRGDLTFTPTAEPARTGYERKFPEMTRKERRFLELQLDASHRAMTTPVRTELK